MLLTRYTNKNVQLLKPTHILLCCLWVLTISLIQGCSSTLDQNTEGDSHSNKKDLRHLGKDIVDMVTIDDKQQTPAQKPLKVITEPVKNLYLEQQAKHHVSAESAANFKAALALMQAKKWQKAQQKLDAIIAQQPELSGSYVNKALIAFKQNKQLNANKTLAQAIKVNPLNPYAYNLQGQIARLQGNFILAEKSYQQALSIWPQYAQAQLNMAILLELYRGRLLEAKEYYQRYLKINPDDKQAQRWLAGLEIKIKRAGLISADSEDTKADESKEKTLNQVRGQK